MSNFLNADFGSSESDDEGFNPGPEAGSDDEAERKVETKDESGSETGERKEGVLRNGRRGGDGDNDDDNDDDADVRPPPVSRGDSDDEVDRHRRNRGEASVSVDGKVERDEDDDEIGNPNERELNGDDDAEDERGELDEELDEEDEDEEEDDDEEEISQRPRKRMRRDQRNAFLDIEAEVERDEEAEEDDEEGPADFIADVHPDDLEALPQGEERDDRRHRELDRQRELEASMDAEQQARALKERYQKYGRERMVAADSMGQPKQLLLPSVDDPSIWCVKCKPTKEKEVIFSITKRIEERALSRNPIPIISAFYRTGTSSVSSGYIYVEARKQTDVMVALDGISNLYPRSGVILISIKEMPDLLKVKKSEPLKVGGYVRIKRGKYAGDLAQIEEVETNGLGVTVKLVPRLDYGMNEDDTNAPKLNPMDAKRKRATTAGNSLLNRPAARLFNESEAKKHHHGRHLTSNAGLSKKSYTYLGETYIEGFLIKEFKVQHLQTEGVNPTLAEVTQFIRGGSDGTDELDLAALAKTLQSSVTADSYLPGDNVEIWEGEQKGVVGKTVSVRGDIVKLQVEGGVLKGQTIDAPAKTLRKRFREGDHVKVIGGSSFRDEVGMVVRIRDERVTLVTDLNNQEITVFSKDLREASETSTSKGLGTYDVHDLVQLDPSTVACVVKVDHESMKVLDQNGTARTILPSQVSNKIEPRKHAVATDRNGSEVRLGDTVKDVYGDNQKGVIIHIYRSFLFLHDREQLDDAGIFVARSTNVLTIAAKGGRATTSTAPDLSKMNPAMMAHRNGMNGNGVMAPPKTMGRDRLLGQTVSIRRGAHKGLMGIVKDTTDLQARVELHTKAKVVTVDKEILGMKDPITGQSMDMSRFVSRPRGGASFQPGSRSTYGGATPAAGNRSEWGGSRIPNAGSATPAASRPWERTPAHIPNPPSNQGGSRIPNRGDRTQYDPGSSTVYGGWGSSGSSTSYGGSANISSSGPPPGYGGATQYGGGFGGATQYGGAGNYNSSSFESGSRTPSASRPWTTTTTSSSHATSHNATGATPSASSSYSSKPWDAPTPGGPSIYNSAPTPNVSAYSAPTPGNSGPLTAPTPHSSYPMDAPTPGANLGAGSGVGPGSGRKGMMYDAPTPAAGGGYGAPTPGFSGSVAETPGPYGAAGYGDGDDADDGPRYDEGTPSP